MSRVTQRKGDTATSRALATFTQLGLDVAVPFTESARYDLIVDWSGTLYRVQCKYSSSRHVDLRSVHSNAGGYVIKRNGESDYDWLYALRPDGREYLFKECLSGRRSVTVSPTYELPDALHI